MISVRKEVWSPPKACSSAWRRRKVCERMLKACSGEGGPSTNSREKKQESWVFPAWNKGSWGMWGQLFRWWKELAPVYIRIELGEARVIKVAGEGLHKMITQLSVVLQWMCLGWWARICCSSVSQGCESCSGHWRSLSRRMDVDFVWSDKRDRGGVWSVCLCEGMKV